MPEGLERSWPAKPGGEASQRSPEEESPSDDRRRCDARRTEAQRLRAKLGGEASQRSPDDPKGDPLQDMVRAETCEDVASKARNKRCTTEGRKDVKSAGGRVRRSGAKSDGEDRGNPRSGPLASPAVAHYRCHHCNFT